MSNNNVNDITNQLILKYDDKFNQLYDENLNINSSIMNKEELIVRINDEINNKNYTISILKYSILFSILLGAVIVLYGLNKFTISKLIIIIIILFLLYLLTIYFGVYHTFYLHNLGKGLRNAKVIMDEYKADLLGILIDNQCPSSCPPIVPPGDNPAVIQGYTTPTLRTDPQLNVWQYGDIPTDVWTNDTLKSNNFYTNYTIPNYNSTLEEEMANSPKSTFGTSYPNSTYYKCKWLGGDNNNGLPNKENNTYSSIPCTYRPNYSEDGRYICSKDPNKISTSEFNKYCDTL